MRTKLTTPQARTLDRVKQTLLVKCRRQSQEGLIVERLILKGYLGFNEHNEEYHFGLFAINEDGTRQ